MILGFERFFKSWETCLIGVVVGVLLLLLPILFVVGRGLVCVFFFRFFCLNRIFSIKRHLIIIMMMIIVRFIFPCLHLLTRVD